MALYDLVLEHLQNSGYRRQEENGGSFSWLQKIFGSRRQEDYDFTVERYCPVEEDFGLTFKVEDLTFHYIRYEDDDQYFNLSLPILQKVNNDTEYVVLKAMNELNASLKAGRFYLDVNHNVWVSFETLLKNIDNTPDEDDYTFLDDDIDIGDILDYAIGLLLYGRQQFIYGLQQQIARAHHN